MRIIESVGLTILAAIFMTIFNIWFVAPIKVSASTSNVTQVITGNAICSFDETHDGQDSSVSIQPDACRPYLGTQDPIINSQGTESTTTIDDVISWTDQREMSGVVDTIDTGRDGDQGVFENTVVEPLASWMGIGNPTAIITNPVVTTAAVGSAAGLVVDALLFQFAYTQRLFGLSKRQIIFLRSAARRVFRS